MLCRGVGRWVAMGMLAMGCAAKNQVSKVETQPVDPAAQETSRLHTWLDRQFEDQLRLAPMNKSYLGIKDEDQFRIDDFSLAGHDARLAWMRDSVEVMKAEFDREALSAEGQTSYDLWIADGLRAQAERPFLRNQFIFEQMDGRQSSLPTFLITIHDVSTVEDLEAYISRIGEIGRAIDQLRERAEGAAADGVHMPRFAYEGAIEQARRVITGAPFEGSGDSALWEDFSKELASLTVDDAQAAELRTQAKAALLEKLGPSYKRLIAWLESDMAKAVSAEGIGAQNLPNGDAFYKERLAFATTTDLTADEIHALGQQEVERILGEMETIKKETGFEGTLGAFFSFLRDDPSQYFPNTDEGREAYLNACREKLALIDEQLPTYFGVLPEADLVVKRVEPFREVDGAAQHYVEGTPDGSRPGTYYVHLSDMNALPIAPLESIAYHEGNPGHHMQVSIAREVKGAPRFRQMIWYSSYGEGWALYSELLAKEMGGYTDPISDFGRLNSEIWRALRLVVDTGLHAKGWTEEQAITYMMEHSSEPEESVRAEVRRYIVWPGQATSYKIGMLKIQDLRARAEAELGDQFDIRAFHDVVLTGGPMPLTMLEKRVEQWILKTKGA